MNKQPEVRERTKKKLIDAFFELGKEKNISQISVGELTRLAGYNRSTFYEYFTDMPDLIRCAEDEILDRIRPEIIENANSFLAEDVQGNNQNGLQFIFSMFNEPMYCLLGPNGDPSFFTRIRDLLLPELPKVMRIEQLPEHFDYIMAFVYSALIGYLQHWHEHGESLPESEFLELGHQLLAHGLLSVMHDVETI